MSSSLERSYNFVFLRNRDLYLHYKKIKSLKSRRSERPPLPSISNLHPSSSTHFSIPKKPPFSYEQKYNIKQSNLYMNQKLNLISKRNNNQNKHFEANNRIMEMKQKARDAVKKLQDKSINQSNNLLKERIKIAKAKVSASMENIRKDYLISRKVINMIKNVKPEKNRGDVYLTKEESNIFKNFYEENKNKNIYNIKKVHKCPSCSILNVINSEENKSINVNNNINNGNNNINNNSCINNICPVKINKVILKKIGYINRRYDNLISEQENSKRSKRVNSSLNSKDKQQNGQ